MQPPVQYALTSDGVRIACWSAGEGEPLVYMNGWPFEHVGLEWTQPDFQLLYGHLIQRHRLVRFDGRGVGLSQRDVDDISLEGRVRDLEAVIDRLGLDRINLVGFSTTGPVAILYATRCPERVARLILHDCHARPATWVGSPEARALQALIRADWKVFTEMMSNIGYGWSAGEQARDYAKFLRDCVSQEMAIRAIDTMREIDVNDMVREIRVPTLVMQHSAVPFPTVEMAQELAAQIPDSRFVMIEGNYGRNPAVERFPVDEFFRDLPISALPEPLAMAREPARGEGLITIMFTDMEDSTLVTQRVGDEQAQELVRAHNEIVREALRIHGGREIKHTGDGIMSSFISASRALECATAVQQGLARRNESHEMPLRVRIGVNAGEPVAEEQDMFGTAVQLAARVCSHAEPDQILVSDVVRQLVAGKGFLFADRGDVDLRGFEDPVRLYEMRWRAEAE